MCPASARAFTARSAFLRVPPDLTVGIDMGGLSHIMRERGEVLNGGHERTVLLPDTALLETSDRRSNHPTTPRVRHADGRVLLAFA